MGVRVCVLTQVLAVGPACYAGSAAPSLTINCLLEWQFPPLSPPKHPVNRPGGLVRPLQVLPAQCEVLPQYANIGVPRAIGSPEGAPQQIMF